MQPLDRNSAQLGRDAEAMRAATPQQRAHSGEQVTRRHVLRKANRALNGRVGLDESR